jgi:hypothetical protein
MQSKKITWDEMKSTLNNVKHIKPGMIESILMQGELFEEKECIMLENIAIIHTRDNSRDVFTVVSLDKDINADDENLRRFLNGLSPSYSLIINQLYSKIPPPADKTSAEYILNQNEIDVKLTTGL